MNYRLGLSSLLLLTGCAVPPTPAPEVVTQVRLIDTSCAGFKPIYPAKTDVLADSTVAQINSHNEYGVKHGCWKAPK